MRTTAALAAFVALAAAGAACAKPSPRIVERSPAEITTAFRNPDMGWLTYVFRPVARPNSAFPGGPREARTTPLSSTVYTNYFTWADLEPVEGYYRWDLIDRFL